VKRKIVLRGLYVYRNVVADTKKKKLEWNAHVVIMDQGRTY